MCLRFLLQSQDFLKNLTASTQTLTLNLIPLPTQLPRRGEISQEPLIQMLKLLLFHPRRLWPPTDSSVKSVTKVSRESRTCSSTEGATTYLGNSDRRPTKIKWRKRYTYAQKRLASTTTLPVPSVTLPGLKSILAGSTARRNGSAISVLRNTLFNPTGKLIRKLAGLGSTSATVAHSSPGILIFILFLWV